MVAKGYHQQQGIDYEETFSLVVKHTTIRTILSLATMFQWRLHQLDVRNAFLHGFLSEEVVMQQPSGYRDASRPDHLCRLNRALYDLKQAPRAWFHRLQQFLLLQGFASSLSDSSLFIKRHRSSTVIILVYVDDLIITGNDSSLIDQVIKLLSHEFDCRDLGSLGFFLGMEILSDSSGLLLT